MRRNTAKGNAQVRQRASGILSLLQLAVACHATGAFPARLDRDLVIVAVEDHVDNVLVADRVARQRCDVMGPAVEAAATRCIDLQHEIAAVYSELDVVADVGIGGSRHGAQQRGYVDGIALRIAEIENLVEMAAPCSPNLKTSPPVPPVRMSLPPPPVRTLSPLLPVMTLSRLFPVPLMLL
jgi:hypothetical protein